MNKKSLTLGSLFDGSGGFPLAAEMCGITPVWASEIDPFCVAVTSKRFPNMKHLGDVTKINGAAIPPVDIITFGSPCQDLSVAGKHAGLDGSRSSLFLEAIRIFKEMRSATNGIYPNVVVWENVPGAYSSAKGEDFRKVLEELAGIAEPGVSIPRPAKGKWQSCGCIMGDGYSIAWRTLDAQYWGVPQRRKRIFLVADFRGGRAPEILFKREGLSRDFKSCRKAGKGIAADNERNTDTSVGEFIPKTLKIRCGCGGGGKGALVQENKSATLSCNNDQILFTQASKKIIQIENISNTLVNGTNPGFHNAVIYDCRGNGDGITCPTITGDHNNRITDYSAICIAGNTIDRKIQNGGNGKGVLQNVSYTLNTVDRHAVMSSIDSPPNIDKMIVRRLMPVEEARLQGFPDWWCADVPHKDTPEYRMWGNGVALPCVLYVMEGVAEALDTSLLGTHMYTLALSFSLPYAAEKTSLINSKYSLLSAKKSHLPKSKFSSFEACDVHLIFREFILLRSIFFFWLIL